MPIAANMYRIGKIVTSTIEEKTISKIRFIILL